jgi:hypothetical protein
VKEEADGSILILDANGVRRVAPDGTISTVTGGLEATSCTEARLADGSRLVADRDGQTVNRVAVDRTLTKVAGTGTCGSSGDGGPATSAELAHPSGVAALGDGSFLIADEENHVIRKVDPRGIISIVAGRDPPLALQCGASGEYGTPVYLVLRVPLRGRAGQPLSVGYETTYDVTARFTIRRGTTVVGRATGRGASGVVQTKLRVSLPAGSYTLEIEGSGVALAAGGTQEQFTKRDVERLVIVR